MVSVRTNIITSVKVTDSSGADSPQLLELVATTSQRFGMAEVTADRAYLGDENLAAIEATGAAPFIPFKMNSQDDGSASWRKMRAVFLYRQEDFLAAYGKRSNIESTFSSVKRMTSP